MSSPQAERQCRPNRSSGTSLRVRRDRRKHYAPVRRRRRPRAGDALSHVRGAPQRLKTDNAGWWRLFPNLLQAKASWRDPRITVGPGSPRRVLQTAARSEDRNLGGQVSVPEWLAANCASNLPLADECARRHAKQFPRLDRDRDRELVPSEWSVVSMSRFRQNDHNQDSLIIPPAGEHRGLPGPAWPCRPRPRHYCALGFVRYVRDAPTAVLVCRPAARRSSRSRIVRLPQLGPPRAPCRPATTRITGQIATIAAKHSVGPQGTADTPWARQMGST